MDEIFENLKKQRKNSVDNLMKWLQDAKLLETSKEAEEKVRKYFEGVKDPKNVELEQFKDVMTKIAEEKKKNIEEATKMLSVAGTQVLDAVQKGIN